MGNSNIRYAEEGQDKEALANIAKEVAAILTSDEEILYIALQGRGAVGKKDAVVATTNRVIAYRPGMFGSIKMKDFQWVDVKDISMSQGFMGGELTITPVVGTLEKVAMLDNDQTKRLYGIAQQQEQDWREKRRVKQMEEDRARSGGFYMAPTQSAPVPAPSAPPPDDPMAKLAKAKAMLDQGLIEPAEYEELKQRILSAF